MFSISITKLGRSHPSIFRGPASATRLDHHLNDPPLPVDQPGGVFGGQRQVEEQLCLQCGYTRQQRTYVPKTSSKARRMTLMGASTPVHISKAIAPW